MKILALQAENIKRLVAVEIRPDGNLVEITGKNGQGKTSVLDAIWWALAGASNIQSTPIRKGATAARIRLDMGEIVVTRTFKEAKDGEFTSGITVENAKGARFPSPQAMLDELLGHLTFDPLAFSRMDPRSQFNTLRIFVPSVDFEAIDRANQGDYTRRTEINRQAKEARGAANRLEIPADTPEMAIDESALIEELEKAHIHNQTIETRKLNRDRVASEVRAKREAAAIATREREELERKVEALRMEADNCMGQAAELESKLTSAPPLPEPIDTTAVREKMNQAREINRNVTLREQKVEQLRAVLKLEDESEKITKAMDARNEAKIKAISEARLPVEGIGFGDGVILLNGFPFVQASDAEQLRASIAIAMALNPKLKVIRVRDGSLLDEDSMKMLAEMAKDKDYQVWVERVDGSGKVGFVLEDGHVKAAAPSKNGKHPAEVL